MNYYISGYVRNVPGHWCNSMHLFGAAGRKASFVISLNVELCAVLSVVGHLHIRHNTPVVILTDDTTISVLHPVLFDEFGN